MSKLFLDLRSHYDRAAMTRIRVAVIASMLMHALVIWGWVPRLHESSLEPGKKEAASGPLQVQLLPRAAPRPAPPPAPRVAPAPSPPVIAKAPPKKTAPKPPPRPPALALDRPAPKPAPPAPPAQPSAPPEPKPAQPPMAGDLSSYIAARRRERGETAPSSPSAPSAAAPPAETTGDPRDQVVAANLGLNRTPTFGQNPETGGGIFQIKRLGYADAEFMFYGWNKDIRRNTNQLIEVRKGNNSSVEIAVVRRMIRIIRENSDGDFLWISQRLGREITLSARPADNAGLEDFLMEEFFGNTPQR